MKKYLILIFISLCLQGVAQEIIVDAKEATQAINNQKSGNSKDILTNLFRASITNLLGDKKEFTLNSTFFGIDSILNPNRKANYAKEAFLRKNSFNIGIKGDSVSNITGFSAGFTFTLIDKRDIKLNQFAKKERDALKVRSLIEANIKKALDDYLTQQNPALYEDVNKLKEYDKAWREASNTNDFSKLSSDQKNALNKLNPYKISVMDSSRIVSKDEVILAILALKNGKSSLNTLFAEIGTYYARKPLWTFSPLFTYDKINKQGDYSFQTTFTAGLGKKKTKNPWETEFKASFKISKDTSLLKTNYDYRPFSISAGINKILIENKDKESQMEFKFFTQLEHQFGVTPAGTKTDVFSLNSTFRINLFKSIWLPLTIKYDVESSNFLGVLAITANIDK